MGATILVSHKCGTGNIYILPTTPINTVMDSFYIWPKGGRKLCNLFFLTVSTIPSAVI